MFSQPLNTWLRAYSSCKPYTLGYTSPAKLSALIPLVRKWNPWKFCKALMHVEGTPLSHMVVHGDGFLIKNKYYFNRINKNIANRMYETFKNPLTKLDKVSFDYQFCIKIALTIVSALKDRIPTPKIMPKTNLEAFSYLKTSMTTKLPPTSPNIHL